MSAVVDRFELVAPDSPRHLVARRRMDRRAVVFWVLQEVVRQGLHAVSHHAAPPPADCSAVEVQCVIPESALSSPPPCPVWSAPVPLPPAEEPASDQALLQWAFAGAAIG